jgi:signal transduction histidine kinase
MTPADVPGIATFLFWIALLSAAEVLPVSLGFQTRVTMSFPITIALSALFEPAVAMTAAAIGAFDARELKGEIPLWRSIFNRSQLVLAVGGASALIHTSAPGELWTFPKGAFFLLAGIVAHFMINFGLVTLMLHRDQGVGFSEALQILLPRPVTGFLLSQATLGALGVATAAAYRQIEFFVAAFLIPLLFARLSLLGARAQQELAQQVQSQQRALLDATEKVFEDREQERNAIAEEIHDSALQLLVGAAYASANSLHYMDDGNLKEARVALASSKAAVEDAIADLRLSLTDLRKSSIEQGGLMETIETFADQMRVLWAADIRIEGRTQQEPPIPVSLAAFQILQEGLTNALKHSNSRSIVVRVGEYDGMVHIEVEDDGPGFDVNAEPSPENMGLQLMRQRADRVGGRIELHSTPGAGTRLEAVLPGRASP